MKINVKCFWYPLVYTSEYGDFLFHQYGLIFMTSYSTSEMWPNVVNLQGINLAFSAIARWTLGDCGKNCSAISVCNMPICNEIVVGILYCILSSRAVCVCFGLSYFMFVIIFIHICKNVNKTMTLTVFSFFSVYIDCICADLRWVFIDSHKVCEYV